MNCKEREMLCYIIPLQLTAICQMICWANVVQFYVFMVNAVLFNVFKPIVLKVNLNEHLQVMTKYIYFLTTHIRLYLIVLP